MEDDDALLSLAIVLHRDDEDESFIPLVNLVLRDGDEMEESFTLGESEHAASFASSVLKVAAIAAEMAAQLEGVTDPLDAENIAMTYAMTHSAEYN